MIAQFFKICLSLSLLTSFATAVDQRSVASQETGDVPRLERIELTADGKVSQVWIRHDEMGVEFRTAEIAAGFRPAIVIEDLKLTLRLKPSSRELGDVRIYTIDGSPQDQLTQQRLAIELSKFPEIRSAGAVLLQEKGGRPYVLRNDLTVTFRPSTSNDAAIEIIKELGTTVVRRFGEDQQSYLVRIADPAKTSLTDTLRSFQRQQNVRHVEFVYRVTLSVPPTGATSACKPWHHENDGSGGKTADADIDTPLAWTFSKGDKITAVIDFGFFADHPDLSPNLWDNPVETLNNLDDDGNGMIDDVHGWDFIRHLGEFVDNSNHGTKDVGLAGARGVNANEIKGSAPEGKIMLLAAETNAEIVQAIDYAIDHQADVISMSFELLNDTGFNTAIHRAVQSGRAGKGCVITVALKWAFPGDDCPLQHYQQMHESVVLVSFCTDKDEKHRPWLDRRAYGNCMSVMAPGKGISTTTDEPSTVCGDNYTASWSGTSAATPITAGVANLVLSVCPTLDHQQVKYLLQDTCDKIEPLVGEYSPVTGFSSPSSGVATHGFGRINAFEAVRLAASHVDGGRGAIDLLVRDNYLDWGNTEQPSSVRFNPTRDVIPYWESPDIKLDSSPSLLPIPTNSQEFESFVDENPQPETDARVYVRVRNRGPVSSKDVRIRLYATAKAAVLPPFPERFWDGLPLLPTDTSDWNFVGQTIVPNLDYSGASLAGSDDDAAAVVHFDWHIPAPADSGGYALLALVETNQDPLSLYNSDLSQVIPRDNNVALRKIKITQSKTADLQRTSYDPSATACWELLEQTGLPGGRCIIPARRRKVSRLNSRRGNLTSRPMPTFFEWRKSK